jgi:ABC-2 type transport system permease protein
MEVNMSVENEFERITTQGWQAGFENLLRAEFNSWWKTRMWWTRMLSWVATIDLIILVLLFELGGPTGRMGTSQILFLYSIMGGLFVAFGAVILMQGAVVGEKISGTAAWVLSKPVSRTAVILSKFIPNAFGVAITGVLVPGLIAYAGLNLMLENAPAFQDFMSGLGILFVFVMFWLVFTLMLGAFYNSNGPVLGISLGLLMGQQFISGLVLSFAPWLYRLLPFHLIMPVNGSNASDPVAVSLWMGQAPDTWVPVYSTIVLIVLCLALGVWRYRREEF